MNTPAQRPQPWPAAFPEEQGDRTAPAATESGGFCHGHGDKRDSASLSIQDRDQGGLLVTCFVGCDRQTIIAALERATGLTIWQAWTPAWAGEPISLPPVPSGIPVYPRVGGGTRHFLLRRPSRLGLSPRGRGNPLACLLFLPVSRSIPAWAGEPISLPPVPSGIPVYPRVGGGTVLISSSVA